MQKYKTNKKNKKKQPFIVFCIWLCVTARRKLVESVYLVYHNCRRCEMFFSHIIIVHY